MTLQTTCWISRVNSSSNRPKSYLRESNDLIGFCRESAPGEFWRPKEKNTPCDTAAVFLEKPSVGLLPQFDCLVATDFACLSAPPPIDLTTQ